MQASMCHQRDERVQKCPAQRPLWHAGHAHQARHQNRNLTCALTSTCFLQHSQTGAASLKHIVKQLNTCAGVTIQVPSNRSNTPPSALVSARIPTSVQVRVKKNRCVQSPSTLCITAVLWQNLLFTSPKDIVIT